MVDLWLVRSIFLTVVISSAVAVKPFGLSDWWAAGLMGAVFGAAILVFEVRLRQVSLKRLLGAASGRCWGSLAPCRWGWC